MQNLVVLSHTVRAHVGGARRTDRRTDGRTDLP